MADPNVARKPLAAMPRTQSRDERIDIRVSEDEKREAVEAALREFGPGGLSRYVRDCFFIGHSMKQAQSRLKVTSV